MIIQYFADYKKKNEFLLSLTNYIHMAPNVKN